MNNYTKEQQTEIIGDAVHLTAAIEEEERMLNELQSESFRPIPSAPVRRVLQQTQFFRPQYPPRPKTNLSFSEYFSEHKKDFLANNKKQFLIVGCILVLFFIISIISTKKLGFGLFGGGIVSVIWLAVLYFGWKFIISYWKTRSVLNKELAESPEYTKAIEDAEKLAAEQQKAADEELMVQQKNLDEQYQKEKDNYDNVIVPQYKREAEMWSELQAKKIAFLEEDLRINRETLKKLYDTTMLVSASYRNLELLQWIYEDMSTSDHDLRYATELLDRDRQRAATLESGSMVCRSVASMNRDLRNGLGAIYAQLERGNDINEEMLDTLVNNNKQLSKVRRDMNIGTVIGTVQRHKTNKILGG